MELVWKDVAWISVLVHMAMVVITLLRVMLRPHREPASRVAWVAVIASLPLLGILAYILLGEIHLGRRRTERIRRLMSQAPQLAPIAAADENNAGFSMPARYESLFLVGKSVSGFDPIGGNRGRLMRDADDMIDSLIADIDQAQHHIHVLFYIWLPDRTGSRVAEALCRAAQRGVHCRAMVDHLGSRMLIGSTPWQRMIEAGVETAIALPIRVNPLTPLLARIDLRNHRKIIVIDDAITYCGSRHCADPEFLVKPKYAPWVDDVIRFEGPIARQHQHLFAIDWMAATYRTEFEGLDQPIAAPHIGFPAQVIGTGPTVRHSAMPEVFETIMYAARRELFVTTPYYVPEESLQSALCAAGNRGVDVRIIFPARNDSWLVAAASRSYYAELLQSGVKIYEFPGGLLHTKSLTIDGDVSLIGSANMDRRSFDLNYENNILFHDAELTEQLRQRQLEYLAVSRQVTLDEVRNWSTTHRLWNNAWAMMGPVL